VGGDASRSYSVVVPVCDEEKCLRELHRRLVAVMENLGGGFEIIYIDDGSRDGSFRVLKEIHHGDDRVTVLQFRRNFGKSSALNAGFNEATGDVVITIDADLQDLPEEIPLLVSELDRGCDLVSSWRHQRQDPVTKRLSSKLYNRVVSWLSGVRIRDFNSGLKCYRREVLDEIVVSGGMHRYIPVLAAWRGFRVSQVKVRHRPRAHGRSKYGTGRMLKGFFDFLTAMMLTKYARRPFHIFGLVGFILILAGLAISAYVTVGWFMGIWIENRPILLLGVLLLIVGFQIVFFGLLCEIVTYASDRARFYSIKQKLIRYDR
jgi:glycosyltransferase involved in cell wall biosynthesis